MEKARVDKYSGYPLLDQSAITELKKWIFPPKEENLKSNSGAKKISFQFKSKKSKIKMKSHEKSIAAYIAR